MFSYVSPNQSLKMVVFEKRRKRARKNTITTDSNSILISFDSELKYVKRRVKYDSRA